MKNLNGLRKNLKKTAFVCVFGITLILAFASASFGQDDNTALNKQFLGTIVSGTVDQISRLLENGADVNFCDGEGRTALHYAVHAKKLEIIELLLAEKPDLTLRNKQNLLPLHQAALENFPEAIRLFLAEGVPVDARGFDSNDGPSESTALILAAQTKAIDAARVLIEAGADVNAITCVDGAKFRRSALFWAIKSGDKQMAAFLEENGAVRLPPGATDN
ncbi:MAG: ankyrin repeat domain-containing protein [Candidatus Riflebacteria bacterium]|nr:ankyrin repeat domain-containing protein [Candidatus Riflebacteria bacterium]